MPTKDQMKRKTCTEKRRKSSRFLSIFPRIRCRDERNASICYDAKLGNHNIPHEIMAKNYALISSPFCQFGIKKRQSLELKLFFCHLFSLHPVENVLHGQKKSLRNNRMIRKRPFSVYSDGKYATKIILISNINRKFMRR